MRCRHWSFASAGLLVSITVGCGEGPRLGRPTAAAATALKLDPVAPPVVVEVPPAVAVPMRVGLVQVGDATPADVVRRQLLGRTDLFAAVTPLCDGADARHGWAAVDADRLADLRREAGVLRLTHLLVCDGTVDEDRRSMPWFAANFATAFAPLALPSVQVDVRGRAAAVLFDVSTGRPVLAASGGGAAGSVRSLMLADRGATLLGRSVREQIGTDLAADVIRRTTAARRR